MVGGRATVEWAEYLEDAETGGNMLTIPVGHLYDSISIVVGELQSLAATVSTQTKIVDVSPGDGVKGGTPKKIQRTAVDHVSFSGLLSSGAQSSVVVYGGEPFPGEPHLIWRIEGEKGVLDVRAKHTFAINMSVGDIKVRLQDFASGEVKEIEIQDDQPGPVGNVGRLYEAFADGEKVPDWKDAVMRHSWVDAVERSSRIYSDGLRW
ncbi:unnamed protein product [Zymoseptoria tritici ST99CH_1E4]|uniref:Gal80p-like C-terminal domain-containing protein n=1 Tax=Zymoseptoria tritici ST99CH_1E4 TaxID=1276532 RepID=A0A2H1FMV2_ZYMTR|nr:unnamed protein product [Zymoseptoria tritici ST99CH_1E4]